MIKYLNVSQLQIVQIRHYLVVVLNVNKDLHFRIFGMIKKLIIQIVWHKLRKLIASPLILT